MTTIMNYFLGDNTKNLRRDTFVRFMIQPSCGFVSNKSILTYIIVSRVGEINMFGFFLMKKLPKE